LGGAPRVLRSDEAILTIVWLNRDKKALVSEPIVGRWLYPVGMLLNALNAFFL
jgi:hypothetical protein